MTRLVLATALALVMTAACGKDAPPSRPAQTAASPASTPRTFTLAIGDATVYELVGRKYDKLDPPERELVLHADGTVEMMFGKDGKPMITAVVKADGTITGAGKTVAVISEHALTNPEGNEQLATIEGNTIAFEIEDKAVKVELAADGNVTVLDSPYKTKWRIEAKDPAVMRTAFLILGITMKPALD